MANSVFKRFLLISFSILLINTVNADEETGAIEVETGWQTEEKVEYHAGNFEADTVYIEFDESRRKAIDVSLLAGTKFNSDMELYETPGFLSFYKADELVQKLPIKIQAQLGIGIQLGIGMEVNSRMEVFNFHKKTLEELVGEFDGYQHTVLFGNRRVMENHYGIEVKDYNWSPGNAVLLTKELFVIEYAENFSAELLQSKVYKEDLEEEEEEIADEEGSQIDPSEENFLF